MKQDKSKSIAILTTGDEVVSGDIMNKNASQIAKLLEENRFNVKTHMAVRDDKESVVQAIKWLINTHKVIITTGGLGPTLDDLTIDAISEATQMPISFNESAWEMVQDIHARLGFACPDNNKRLARFISSSILFEPINGTAHGSLMNTGDNIVIALPGPPKECMPMILKDVIPYLKEAKLDCGLYRTTIYLFAASESHIASLVEPLCLKHQLDFGFRTSFPFLELKVFTEEPNPKLDDILEAVDPWYIGSKVINYETLFMDYYLTHSKHFKFIVNDHAKHVLDWLPDWHMHNGENEINVQFNQETNMIETSFQGHKNAFTINKKFNNERILALVKAWLSMQWFNWLNLS